MNRSLLLPTLAFGALLLSQPGYCSNVVTARVLYLGTYGNGNLFIGFDQPIDEAGCVAPYLELPANAPAIKATLATATVSLAMGLPVKVKTDGCYNALPSFTGARPAWLQLDKP